MAYGYGYNNSYYHPNYFQQQNQQQPIRIMLVSNEEEAKATPADLNGNPTFFYNKSMNKVYLKQINPQTGAAPLQVFNAEKPLVQENETTSLSEKHYNTIIEGINGLYRLLAPSQTISTQPPIMTEEKKNKSNAKIND